MARPRKQLDEKLLFDLARIGCTDEEIATVLSVSSDTLVRRFAEHIKKGRAEMKMSLRRMQIKMVEDGSVGMAVWLGKQYLGQREPKIEIDVNKLDADIERELALIAAGSKAETVGEAEEQTVH
jgi:hypothetical protein